MDSRERWLAAGVMVLATTVVSRGSPAMTGEAPSYLAIAHSIAHDRDLDLRNQYNRDGRYPFRHLTSSALTVYGSDGGLYPVEGLGWGLAMAPVLRGVERFVGLLPDSFLDSVRWDRTRAVRDLLSTVMAMLAAWAAVLTLRASRGLGGVAGWSLLATAVAFLTPPLLFAAINPGTELPAAILCLWFLREARRPASVPWRALLPLALLPWLHLRYTLIIVAGLLWMGRRGRSAVWAPLVSVVLLAAVNVWLSGSPVILARQFSTWKWIASMPGAVAGAQTGLLWMAPFWLVAIAGTGAVARDEPGYERFAWRAVLGLVLLHGLFDTAREAHAARLTLVPALPLLVPLVSRGLNTPTVWLQRALVSATVAWAVALVWLVVQEPGQLVAGAEAGPLPAAVSGLHEWNAPQAKLRRRGYVTDDAGFVSSIERGDLEALSWFLDAGFPAGRGLVVSVERGQADSRALLLARGAATSLEAARALALAESQGDRDTIDALRAAGVTLDVPDRTGETALMAAVRDREADRRALLLASGANVDARTRVGDTALTFAVRAVDTAALSDLLEAGADPDIADLDGWTPLMVAVRLERMDAVTRLIAGGADVNARSRLGWTALIWAAYQGSADLVSALLDAGADAHVSSVGGRSALIRAAGAGHLEIVARLLAAGADPGLAIDGEDARAWAARNGHAAVADLIARARRIP
jgi:ankyrin repeat protein